jgi:hypothetical protein
MCGWGKSPKRKGAQNPGAGEHVELEVELGEIELMEYEEEGGRYED